MNDTHRIRVEVTRKLVRYRKTDQRRKFADCPPTMSVAQGLSLVLASGGRCAACKEQMIMYGWPTMDPKQFSFDRIDDEDTHHADNVRITCLACNVAKADAVHKPVYGPVLVEYERVRQLTLAYKPRAPTLEECQENAKYAFELRQYLAHLHEQVYADRKHNGWLPAGATFRTTMPTHPRDGFSDDPEFQL